ncbi:hypothetical protein Btru_022494 [Bulinus truncatus]|nr:hypothetical protein Btru_022494 [Bulinus truncatus]
MTRQSCRECQLTSSGVYLLIYLVLISCTGIAAFVSHLEWGPDLSGPWCAQRPRGLDCCSGRDDLCAVPILGTECYCDVFCNLTANDCCPDYFSHCHGYQWPTTTPRPTTLLPPRTTRATLGPYERDMTGPCERCMTGSYERDMTGPCERNMTGPYERDMTGPYERDMTGPCERDMTGPYERDMTGPCERCMTGPYERDMTGPNERDMTGPYERDMTGPYERGITGPFEQYYSPTRKAVIVVIDNH